MDCRVSFGFLDALPELRDLGFVFPQPRLEIVFFVFRFAQLCFGDRDFRSGLAERVVGRGQRFFSGLPLLFPCDAKLFRRISRNFGLGYTCAQSPGLPRIKDA